MKKKNHLIIGLVLVLLSSALYAVAVYFDLGSDGGVFSGLFFVHYAPTILYFFIVKRHEDRFWRFFQKDGFAAHTLLLVLFNICAYSLNRTIPVFNTSTDWLTAFLLVENSLLVAYAMAKTPPKWFEAVICFFFGAALVFNVYQLFMVLPASLLGILGAPILGISLLLFVPVFYLACIITMLRRLLITQPNRVSFAAGLALVLGTVGYYSVLFKHAELRIVAAKLRQDAPFASGQALPDWIPVAQALDGNALTEKYLKTGLVYQSFPSYTRGPFSSINSTRFGERYVHDPLVAFAALFTDLAALDQATKIKVLNYLYDTRHQTTERFWRGENLKTRQIVANVELFPAERLSYTEQVITIKNDRDSQSRWGNQQEALYTFDLPDGGVVTALSLWINGMEEQGILTAKKKAEKAYNTIVGKEMRDPSVVYWMEGNKIRVRVFPCTPQEDRKFKIGVTAPLSLDGERLVYHAMGFEGPDYTHAASAVHVVSHGAAIVSATLGLEKGPKYYTWRGGYRGPWQLAIANAKTNTGAFSFRDEHFKVAETRPLRRDYRPATVYLDVSSAWTKSELKKISKAVGGMAVVAFTTQFWPVDAANMVASLGGAALPAFTLFPFHQADADQSMVITKGGMPTPNLADLKDTRFRNQLFQHIKNQGQAPLVVDIGAKPSDYMMSLKAFGVIEHHTLGIDALVSCLATGSFPMAEPDPNVVAIPQNGLSIIKSNQALPSAGNASDHVMRLYYYQTVLREIGNKYFTDDKNEYIEERLVNKAVAANIVTPLSSLVVLESQRDYDRFGIKRQVDALGNASINNEGAVPEPHEWALAIIGLGLLAFMYWRPKQPIETP